MSGLDGVGTKEARDEQSRMPGIADARPLPDRAFAEEWASVVLPAGMKEGLLRTVVANIRLRSAVPFPELPLHGVMLLSGAPGVGKTTLARGLADKAARTLRGPKPWTFVEVDPHELGSSSLGRSQRAVSQLFGVALREHAVAGPLIVLLDEVETLFTDRQALSMETNPVDVHRAVDAALVGLDQLARGHAEVLIMATSNFPGAIDPALASRSDTIIEIPLPDIAARRAILEKTIAAVAAAFPGAGGLLDPAVLEAAAEASAGLDGRRVRKSVAAACAVSAGAQGNPDLVSASDLLTALGQMAGAR